MGIKRTVEWKLRCPADEAEALLVEAFRKLEMEVTGNLGAPHASAGRSMRKNRWASEIDASIRPGAAGSVITMTVEMLGNKHFEVLGDVIEAIGGEYFDDRGLTHAVERLGKVGRLFGRKEVRHLRNLLWASENVLELGQGTYGTKQGLLVLTDQRLFFFEKSLGSETVEEFSLTSISSMSASKKMTGETLTVHASGNSAEIKNMGHGQGDAISRAFRNAKATPAPTTATAASPPADDPIAQLHKLAALRDAGVISEEEFAAKKTEVMGRI